MDVSLLVEAKGVDNSTYPGIEPTYLLAEKIVAGSACILSVFGALLVIFSFAYNGETKFSLKELLYYQICCGYPVKEKDESQKWVTKYKLKSYNFILINLSIADIIVASSHFWGLLSNLESKFAHNSTHNVTIIYGYDISCTTQSTFTVLATLSSFFWTDILAVFLAFNIAFKTCTNNRLSKLHNDFEKNGGETKVFVSKSNCCNTPLFLYIIFPFIGWGIPMIMLLVFATKNMLGYVEDYDGGWCYFYLNPSMPDKKREEVIYLGYEMWLWGSVLIVLACMFVYVCFSCIRGKKSKSYKADCTHIRYFSVGIAFAMLRIPSTIVNVYMLTNKNNYKTIAAAVINIVASATISLQGGVNGIIYLCCRTSVKKKCFCNHELQNDDENRPLMENQARINEAQN